MKTKRTILVILSLLGIFLTSCAASDESKGNEVSYEETKKMIVDILKTDEGKKALQEVLSDEQFKQEIIMNQEETKKAIEETLVSEKGKQFWEQQLKDEKFAQAFAKSMEKPFEDLMKGLMNDPEYQKKMMELMQNPEMEKNYTKLIKSNEMRSHFQKLIQETFENPMFKAEIFDMLKKIADEQLNSQSQESSNKKSGNE